MGLNRSESGFPDFPRYFFFEFIMRYLTIPEIWKLKSPIFLDYFDILSDLFIFQMQEEEGVNEQFGSPDSGSFGR